jgi:hypothetical protein
LDISRCLPPPRLRRANTCLLPLAALRNGRPQSAGWGEESFPCDEGACRGGRGFFLLARMWDQPHVACGALQAEFKGYETVFEDPQTREQRTVHNRHGIRIVFRQVRTQGG